MFLEKGSGGRERERHRSAASYTPPDRKLNPQPFGARDEPRPRNHPAGQEED